MQRSLEEVWMKAETKFLVLFPGAWGNSSVEDVQWWFERFKPMFGGYKVVSLVYEGRSLDEIALSVRYQLQRAGVPPGSHALCYSMGSQVLRSVMAVDRNVFARAIFISGLERRGIRIVAFIQIVFAAFWSFTASLLTGRVYFRSAKHCHRVMFSSEQGTEKEAETMLVRMKPEPMWMKIAQVFLPGFRKTLPPLTIPVQAIIPADDLIIGGSKYKGENVRVVNVTGAHAFIRHGSPRFDTLLSQISRFLAA